MSLALMRWNSIPMSRKESRFWYRGSLTCILKKRMVWWCRIFEADELARKYHAQLDYYGKALEQMTLKRVKEKILYSFTIKKEIGV